MGTIVKESAYFCTRNVAASANVIPKCHSNKHLFWKRPSVHSFRLSSKSSNIYVKSCSLLILPTPVSTWCRLRIHTKWALNPYVIQSGCVTERKCIHKNWRGEGKNLSAGIFHAVLMFLYSEYCSKFTPTVNRGSQSLYFNVLFISAFSGSKRQRLSKCYPPRKFCLFLIVLPFLI